MVNSSYYLSFIIKAGFFSYRGKNLCSVFRRDLIFEVGKHGTEIQYLTYFHMNNT